MITFIVPPLSAPAVAAPKLKPKPLDWLDEKLLESLREAGSCPTWTLLNIVANDGGPLDRTAGRLFRLQLLHRLKRLRKLGLVFSFARNRVSAIKPDLVTRRPVIRRRRRTVATSRSVRAVSVVTASGPQEIGDHPHRGQFQMDKRNLAPNPSALGVEKSESGCERERITEAAKQLARLPRRPKRIWSGWLGATRSYCGMAIRLSTGEPMFVFGVLRGRVVYSREPGVLTGSIDGAGVHWGVLPAKHVKIVPNPNAILLGRRKRGTRERPSPLKAASARRNGAKPARRGRRGRPLKLPALGE